MNNQNSAQEHGVGSTASSDFGGRVLVVRATHEYVPVNNDELHIRVGDLITITNPEEGGWWEGTLGARTGWFPSNYVTQVEEPVAIATSKNADEYKSVIVGELLESERSYVREMDDFHEAVLKNVAALIGYQGDPLVSQLQSSYSALITAHKTHVLGPLQGSGAAQRVGKIFMGAAPEISQAHTTYCGSHPKFVQFIERHQDKLSGAFGDQAGVLRIITCLSAPFRRIEKYGNALHELERYVEEYHPDKGDVQRGGAYYRNLEKSLTSLRKQKEMELEILTSVVSGAIRDYEGPEVTGEIMLLSSVHVGRDKQPRYFVLFPNTLLILAYDNVSNTLTYKGRIYVTGITVSCIDGDETVTHAFEISGPTIHPMLVQCPSGSVRSQWLSTLNELLRSTRCYSAPHSQSQHLAQGSDGNAHVIGALAPPLQAWNITRLRPSAPYNPFLAEYRGERGTPRSSSSSSGFERGGGGSFKFNKSGSFSGGVVPVVGVSRGVSNEEDLCVLGIVDGFCGQNNRSSASPVIRSNPINKHLSTPSNHSNVLGNSNAGNSGLVVGGVPPGGNLRNLPQLVSTLRDDVNLLNDKIGQLSRQLEEDRNVRGQLIELIGKLSADKNGN